jgi:hypothetical protein
MDGNIVLDLVSEPYIDIITFPCINSGSRKLSIDGGDGLS